MLPVSKITSSSWCFVQYLHLRNYLVGTTFWKNDVRWKISPGSQIYWKFGFSLTFELSSLLLLSDSFRILNWLILFDMMRSFFQLVESCVTKMYHLFLWHPVREIPTPMFYWVNINGIVKCTCKIPFALLLWQEKVLSDLHMQQVVECDAEANIKIIDFWDMTACTLVLTTKLLCWIFSVFLLICKVIWRLESWNCFRHHM
jgi:hypothetical protein